MTGNKFKPYRELRLDDLMESCLKTGEYDLMEKLLKQTKETYDRFDYYMEKLKNEKANTHINDSVFC